MKKCRYGSRYCKFGRHICAISAVLLYPPPYLPFYNIYHNICYHIHHNIYLTPDHMGTYTLSTTISTTASRAYNIHHNIYLMLQYPPHATISTTISTPKNILYHVHLNICSSGLLTIYPVQNLGDFHLLS